MLLHFLQPMLREFGYSVPIHTSENQANLPLDLPLEGENRGLVQLSWRTQDGGGLAA
jgi:hypothetical protein